MLWGGPSFPAEDARTAYFPGFARCSRDTHRSVAPETRNSGFFNVFLEFKVVR